MRSVVLFLTFSWLVTAGGHTQHALELTVGSDESLELVLSAPTGYHFGALSADIDGVEFGVATVSAGTSGKLFDAAASSAGAVFTLPGDSVLRQGSGRVTVRESHDTFSFVAPHLYASRV